MNKDYKLLLALVLALILSQAISLFVNYTRYLEIREAQDRIESKLQEQN